MSITAPGPLRLAVAGIGLVGTAFGMARYGYGLLLPDMQRAYGLDGAALGAIGAGSYAAYLLAVAGRRSVHANRVTGALRTAWHLRLSESALSPPRSSTAPAPGRPIP